MSTKGLDKKSVNACRNAMILLNLSDFISIDSKSNTAKVKSLTNYLNPKSKVKEHTVDFGKGCDCYPYKQDGICGHYVAAVILDKCERNLLNYANFKVDRRDLEYAIRAKNIKTETVFQYLQLNGKVTLQELAGLANLLKFKLIPKKSPLPSEEIQFSIYQQAEDFKKAKKRRAPIEEVNLEDILKSKIKEANDLMRAANNPGIWHNMKVDMLASVVEGIDRGYFRVSHLKKEKPKVQEQVILSVLRAMGYPVKPFLGKNFGKNVKNSITFVSSHSKERVDSALVGEIMQRYYEGFTK